MTIHATRIPLCHLPDPTDADAAHKLTMSLFGDLPSETARAAANVLWRLEQEHILVTSTIPAIHLPDDADTITFDPEFTVGRRVRFIATVDAVARVRGRSVRVSDVDGWFAAKTAHALGSVTVLGYQGMVVTRRKAPLEQVTIVGEAVVADPAELVELVRTGVGRSKTFGCGMLTVAAS